MRDTYRPDVLRRLRKELGLSQSQLANLLGVTETSYRAYERSSRSPYSHGPGGYVVHIIHEICRSNGLEPPALYEFPEELAKMLKEWSQRRPDK